MRIVQYLGDLELKAGGVTRAVVDLCLALSLRGHEVTLLTRDAADSADQIKSMPNAPALIELPRVAGPIPHLQRAGARLASKLIGETELVHLHVVWDPVTLQLGRIARRLGKPYIISLHGMLDDWTMSQKRLKKRLYLAMGGRKLLASAAGVHCTAKMEVEQAARWFPQGRAVSIPLVTDMTIYRDLPTREAARRQFPDLFADLPVALFVGRLHPIKRIELLIEAAAILKERGTPCRIALIGSGERAYECDLRRLAQSRNIGDEVHQLGFIAGAEKVALYTAADAFVLPSRHENWGFVLIEALACGTPIVTTRHVAIWRDLLASGAVEIVDDAPASFADAMHKWFNHPNRWTDLRTRARNWVMRDLEDAEVIRRYEALYREAAKP